MWEFDWDKKRHTFPVLSGCLVASASASCSLRLLDPIWSFCYHHLQNPVADRKSSDFSLIEGNNLWNCLIRHTVLRCYLSYKSIGFWHFVFYCLELLFFPLWSTEQLWVQEVTASSSVPAALQRRHLQSFYILRQTFPHTWSMMRPNHIQQGGFIVNRCPFLMRCQGMQG